MRFFELLFIFLIRLNPAHFLMGWVETRPWRLIVAGIPVVAAIVATVALRAATRDPNGDAVVRHYLTAAGDVMRNGDHKGAELRFRRAELMAPEDPRPRFGLATLAEKQGEPAKAAALMEQLAAEPGDVGIHANLWLIAKTPRKDLDLAGRQLLIRRLERAIKSDPTNLEARVMLAGVYAQTGFPDQAVAQLRVAAEARPALRIPLVQLLLASGRKDGAREAAADAERFFKERLAKEPGDTDSRIYCVSALVFQQKYLEALQLLEQGRALSDPVLMQKSISGVTSAWAGDLRDRKEDPRRVMELTSAALRADPSNSTALMLLADLSRDEETGTQAIEMLQERLAAGESPWLIHMLLGTRFLEQGKTAEGAQHLEQAVKLNPSAVVAMNNLAWTLATQEPVDLKRAEELVRQAVALAPANPQIRETRGQIHLKQERWKEALLDLEAVLPIYSREAGLRSQLPHLHRSLAKAYEELGNKEMARRHRELSEARTGDPAAPPVKAVTPAADAPRADPIDP